MARTREKVVIDVSQSYTGKRPAEEVFADAFAVHLNALSHLNRQVGTFVDG